MKNFKKRILLIKMPYWLGIAADAIWTAALFSPEIFGFLTSNPDFNPDIQTRQIMGIGGSLMAGWTLLLIWAVRKPVERRVVSLLTAFPVVFGIFFVTLTGFLNGNNSNIWLLFKSSILFILLITSYILAGKKNLSI